MLEPAPAFADRYNAAEDLLGRNLAPGRAARVAYIDRDGAHTYAALAERSARFATALRELGVEPEQRVALCLEDTVDFPACFLGAIQAGVVPIPLNTRLTAKDYAYILADSRARALIVSAPLLDQFMSHLGAHPQLRAVVVAGDPSSAGQQLDALLETAAPAQGFASTRRDEPCFWLYTSGTTGAPKGVVHLHGHLLATAELYARPILGLTPDDVVFSAAKLFFAYGLGNALTFPMAVGATTVLLEGPPRPDRVGALLRRHRPTIFYGVPTLFGMLLAQDEQLPARGEHRLRLCTSAGEALPPELLRRWRARVGVDILDGIGTTEALHIFLSNRVGDIRPGSTGRPVDGYEVRLVDEDDHVVAPGELGTLEVRGPSTALMYWNLRERTKATFRGPWLRTGDKYHVDEDGYYHYGGRADDLLKVGGIYVSPFEVESALLQHEAVLESAVVGHADHDGLIKPRAFVVLAPGAGPANDELARALTQFVRDQLAPFKRPRWIDFVDELPKTATGKIQRYKLRDA
ncbi:MAG: benzoate-CoA ligase family protein [Myxococcales bacterium]|nr:benzoate-CoA ligase family protein [Myxococcales bacterium]